MVVVEGVEGGADLPEHLPPLLGARACAFILSAEGKERESDDINHLYKKEHR